MLPPWFPTAALVAAATGPVSHYAVWIHGEWDGVFYKVVPSICLTQLSTFFLIHWSGQGWFQSVYLLSLLVVSYVVPLFISIGVYRVFLHPTCKFPGPFWARLSSWWRVRSFINHNEQAYAVTHELHQKYGGIVRAGPRHLSVNHVDAIAAIYGSNSGCIKSANYMLMVQDHLQTIRDPAKHKHRRFMWDRGLNAKACQTYLPRVNRVSNLFVDKLTELNGQPISINDWCHYVTFDVMGEIGFGKSYGQLESSRMHPSVEAISKFLSIAVSAWQVPWALNLFLLIPGLPDPAYDIKHNAEVCVMERKKEEPPVPDIMSYVFTGYEDRSKWLVDDRTMIDDAFMLQTAGSDTSYSAIVHAFYYLANDRSVQQQLRAEVCDSISSEADPNWSQLSTLPLLDGIVNETLRLHPPVPSGMPRETPKSGAQIGPYWIPGETIVAVPTYTIQRDARYFAEPNTWIPERWFSRTELILDRHAWIPFSVGPYNCAGKYFALMEIKLLLAKAVIAFDIKMAPGEDGRKLLHGCKDYMTLWLPDLWLCMRPREKK